MSINAFSLLFQPEVFQNRVYGVTGGGHGIGHAIVQALIAHGARVVVIEFDETRAHELRSGFAANTEQLEVVIGDASDENAIDAAIDISLKRWGNVDGWVNNAFFSRRESISAQAEADFQRAWEVNVLAIWRSCRKLLPVFQKNGGGAIVSMSSIMASQTAANCAAYSSSKAGIEGMTRALAVELAASRVRVNAVAPGYILTYEGIPESEAEARRRHELISSLSQPWGDAGMPEDIANVVLFLLSPGARFMTGTTVHVDGGLLCELRSLYDRRRAKQLALDLGETK